MNGYSMPRYFQNMPAIGEPLYNTDAENRQEIKAVEKEIFESVQAILAAGRSDESLNSKGQLTAMQRIHALIDEGTWYPLNSLYNPSSNSSGSTNVIKGLGRVNGRWAVISFRQQESCRNLGPRPI